MSQAPAASEANREPGRAFGSVPEEQAAYRQSLSVDLEQFLEIQRGILEDVSAESVPLLGAVQSLARGGKRLRALLNYWGWRGAGGDVLGAPAVRAGVALELFQSAALIHDDIIDRSDTRRGAPSVHRHFSNRHAEADWFLDGAHFGSSAAILAGDLCLALSEEAFASVGERAAYNTRARALFNRMRTEVMAGQYLDILEEVVGPGHDPERAVVRARNILRYKSAKYSIEHPLAIGGALAGAGDDLLAAYSEFSLPLGEAFQLRDDVLGVFGDPELTGKPAGDDLREGKRTVLIAYALSTGSEAVRKDITDKLGRPDLNDDAVASLRTAIEESGALATTESLIAEHTEQAFSTLAALAVDEQTRSALESLAHAAVTRTA